MPVIRLSLPRLLRLIGIPDLDVEHLQEILFRLKCESEISEDGRISIEVQSDRPDMFSAEGIARAIRMYLGIEKPRVFELGGIEFKVFVDPPVKRPYIAIAAVTGVELGEEGLEELIQFQEKLHITYGRNRKKIAIGLHDLEKVPSREIYYREVDIDSVEFVPLHHTEKMTLRKVLEVTEQGRAYGWISINGNRHPVIFAGSDVISVPPVINAELTRIEPETKNILIDVTGIDLEAVINTVNIIATSLAFYGGRILGAEIVYPDTKITTPDLSWREVVLDLEFASSWLGVSVEELKKMIPDVLERMGLKVKDLGSGRAIVSVPPYRVDILHPVDVVEDIAVGIGYDQLGPMFVESYIPRRPSFEASITQLIRDVMVGLGYLEVNTFTLTPRDFMERLGVKDFVIVENPLSVEMSALRNNMMVSMLQILAHSQHAALPVKIFEIGEVIVRSRESYTGWRNEVRLAFARMDSVVRFEEIHADIYALLKELGIEPLFRRCTHELLIEGRTACIEVEGEVVGVFGEVKPEILDRLEIRYPIAIAEIYLEKLLQSLSKIVRLGV